MKPAPHIAILGAGPIGLDAALAARESGWTCTVFEAGPGVGSHVRAWGHVRMFSPWALDLSERMRRALAAPAPADDPEDCPTGAEYVERVLEPLAGVLAGCIHTGARVVAVSRDATLKDDGIGSGVRALRPFRILVAHADGRESVHRADVVLDCTGTYGQPNPLGDGGIPAPGERAAEADIVRSIPDVRSDASGWKGRRVLLVGAGHSAQTAARDLAGLAERTGTQVLWAVREDPACFEPIPDDPLPERAALARSAAALAAGRLPAVQVRAGRVVDAVAREGDALQVDLRRSDGAIERERVDRIVSLTGSIGDAGLYRQLQVHECWATAGLMKLSAALLGAGSSADCLDQGGHGIDALRSPEPDFFVLGSKSYGRNNTFLLKVGFEQVDDVFAHLRAR
ncbi:MAG: FAD-dependent oxidoreductase [Gemmatimonadota bacterium]|nr:FAD-dependent oxidoreductase [Gemmatimonadota bacterium]